MEKDSMKNDSSLDFREWNQQKRIHRATKELKMDAKWPPPEKNGKGSLKKYRSTTGWDSEAETQKRRTRNGRDGGKEKSWRFGFGG